MWINGTGTGRVPSEGGGDGSWGYGFPCVRRGHHYASGQSLCTGEQEDPSHTHYRSDLRQGEIERHKLKCHRLRTVQLVGEPPLQQGVVERNQFLAGHHGGSYEEEYEPLQYPAQRSSAARKRKHDASGPISGQQNQFHHDPSMAIFPPSIMGLSPSPSSSSSTTDPLSGSPISSSTSGELDDDPRPQLIVFPFEEDSYTAKSAKKAKLSPHVVAQLLFINPSTQENPDQDDDSGYEEGVKKDLDDQKKQCPEQEGKDSADVEENDPDPLWSAIPKPCIKGWLIDRSRISVLTTCPSTSYPNQDGWADRDDVGSLVVYSNSALSL